MRILLLAALAATLVPVAQLHAQEAPGTGKVMRPDCFGGSTLPTTIEGPRWSMEVDYDGHDFRLTAWRRPCDDGVGARLLLTVEPLTGGHVVPREQITIQQDGVMIADKFASIILNGSVNGPGEPTTFPSTKTVWLDDSQAHAELDELGAMTIGWREFNDTTNRYQMEVPAYDASEYTSDRRLQVGLTGTYFDPDRSGEGVLIDFGKLGSTPRAFFTWYTYTDGDQTFLVGTNQFTGDDRTLELEVFQTEGGQFGDDFDPAQVTTFRWGEVTLTFPDCETMVLDYAREDGNSGQIIMGRALERLGDLVCI